VIGLEVLNNEIVWCATIERCLKVLQPLIALTTVYGIHNRNLLIEDNI
jgi:hypothetical protein